MRNCGRCRTGLKENSCRAALERGGVDFFLRTFEDTAYDGFFVAQEGWGVLWVAPEDRQLAEDIVQKFDEAYAPGFEEEIEPQ